MYNFFTIVTTFAPFFSLSRKLGGGSEMQNRKSRDFHFAFRSPCTNFAPKRNDCEKNTPIYISIGRLCSIRIAQCQPTPKETNS